MLALTMTCPVMSMEKNDVIDTFAVVPSALLAMLSVTPAPINNVAMSDGKSLWAWQIIRFPAHEAADRTGVLATFSR